MKGGIITAGLPDWIALEDEDSDVRVYRLFGRAHDTDHGTSCWCEPERDAEEPRVIVHRREQ